MSRLRGALHSLSALWRRERYDRELDEEINFHIEREEEENQRKGMAPSIARKAALASFGKMEEVKRQARSASQWGRLGALVVLGLGALETVFMASPFMRGSVYGERESRVSSDEFPIWEGWSLDRQKRGSIY